GGAALVRAFVGGSRDPERAEVATDGELIALVTDELTRLMGPLGKPRFARVYRYLQSNPQPLVGHGARLSRIRERLAVLPGLHVAGAAYDGVGIPDCVRQARAVASAIATELSAGATARDASVAG